VNQKQLFLDLEALSEEQIEVGLQAGVWGDPARPVVERYLDQMKPGRVEAAASEQLAAAREAIKCYEVWAISALIIAGGAMLAAMASAFVAFLALRQDDLLVTLSASGFTSMDTKPEILTSPSFFLKTQTSDIEQRRRLRARVEAMTPEQQKALLAILTQSRETEKSTSD